MSSDRPRWSDTTLSWKPPCFTPPGAGTASASDSVQSSAPASSAGTRSTGGKVKSPRHVLYCRWDDDVLVVGRILGDVMEPELHITPDMDWE
jgi:hypothetical protein